MNRLTRDGTAEPVSRDQILRHARGEGTCSADHEQDWQPYPVDPYSAICDDHTYIPDVDGDVLPVESTTQTVFNGDGIIIGGAREPLSRDKNYKPRTRRFGPFWVEGQGFGKVDAGLPASCINLRPPS